MKYSKADKAEAIERLRSHLRPAAFEQRENGSRHYTEDRQKVFQIVRSVSQSGVSRVISTLVVDSEGELLCLDWAIAVACDLPLAKGRGVKISGCGMDMGLALLDNALHQAFAVPTDVTNHEGEIVTILRTEVSANDFRTGWL